MNLCFKVKFQAKPILEKGEKLATFQPGTKERAEKTKEFLDDLFAFLENKLPF